MQIKCVLRIYNIMHSEIDSIDPTLVYTRQYLVPESSALPMSLCTLIQIVL